MNCTAGMLLLPPTLPVRVIDASHSEGVVPSAVSGNSWLSAQASTSLYDVPTRIWVVIDVSRFRVQNVGEKRSVHASPALQF
ncbi:hypothetical protein NKG94_16835 [Micromonospora sp. M12]